MSADEDINAILHKLGAGVTGSSQLMETLYAELRAMADQLMQGERGEHTLQATALVHEAFLRLVDAEKAGTRGRAHFLSAAAVTMRRVLVDHARAKRAAKRGGREDRHRITLRAIVDDHDENEAVETIDFEMLDEALQELSQVDERQAKLVEMRFFGGMTGQQIGDHLGISRNTVVRDLAFARAWLTCWMDRRES